jgi:hypothetical protein
MSILLNIFMVEFSLKMIQIIYPKPVETNYWTHLSFEIGIFKLVVDVLMKDENQKNDTK